MTRSGCPLPPPGDRTAPVVTDGQGIALAVSPTGGNRNDGTQFLPLLDKIPTVAGVVRSSRQVAK